MNDSKFVILSWETAAPESSVSQELVAEEQCMDILGRRPCKEIRLQIRKQSYLNYQWPTPLQTLHVE